MNKILSILSSLKIMVASLLWLFLLTFWGTIAQVDLGLYSAQEKFFYSWFFNIGVIPLPGARLTLWVLFINLLAVTITRFSKYRKKRHWGLIVIHFGLLIYLLGAFVTFHSMKESNVHLLEKAGTNLSASYTNWEISFWPKEQDLKRDVIAVSLNNVHANQEFHIEKLQVSLIVDAFYENALAFQKPEKKDDYLNATEITQLTLMPLSKQHEENIAGIEFQINHQSERLQKIRLYGGEEKPLPIRMNNKDYYVQLRRQQSELPFSIMLDDFRAEFHPGTEMARSYESDAIVEINGLKRKVNISMNEPFRYKNFTVFQAAYAIDEMGREYSTFAVVENKGRLLPYISSLIVFLGLFYHVIAMAFTRKKYN